jgi:hypothetical protein
MLGSSAKNDGARGDFLDYTIAVWQPYSARPLTREDAREISHNVAGFFRILQEWADEERRTTISAESSPLVTAQSRRESTSSQVRPTRSKRRRNGSTRT